MSLNRALYLLSEDAPDNTTFTKSLKPEWIEQVLRATNTATVRSQKLPPEKVVCLVIGMALFTDRSIKKVLEHLKLAMSATMAASALTQARSRLTASLLRWLLERVALAWRRSDETLWRGLSLYGVDGSHQRVAASAENHAHFGPPSRACSFGLSSSAFCRLDESYGAPAGSGGDRPMGVRKR